MRSSLRMSTAESIERSAPRSFPAVTYYYSPLNFVTDPWEIGIRNEEMGNNNSSGMESLRRTTTNGQKDQMDARRRNRAKAAQKL